MKRVAAALLLLAACTTPASHRPFADPENRHHPERRHDFDLHHYAIEVVPDFDERTVHGYVEVTFSSTTQSLKALRLDAGDMVIHRATVDGKEAHFDHRGDELVIALPHPMNAGARAVAGVRYTARPTAGMFFILPDSHYPKKPRQVWTQGETEYNHLWVPCYDYPNDRATAEYWILTPAGMIAIANGDLVEVRSVEITEAEANAVAAGDVRPWRERIPAVPRRAGPYKLWHFSMDQEFVSYLMSIVIGDFDVWEEAVLVDGREVPLRYNVPRGALSEEQVRRMFGRTAEMMEFFGDLIDAPYPWSKYEQTLVADFSWGGMENVTVTTLNGDRLISGAQPGSDYSPEGLIAHELAHMWFGDLLTCRDWAHIWLNETFATFLTNWWYHEKHSVAEFEYQIWNQMNATLGEDAEYERPIVNSVYTDPDDMFDTRTYGGGAVMMNQLREVVGDGAFFNGLHTYVMRHRNQVVTTEQLRDAFETAAGRDLGWFFDQWIYGTKYPEFRVSSVWNPGTNKVQVRVLQTHEVTARRRLFRTPVDIGITTSAGTEIHRVEIDEREEEFILDAAERPLLVDFDAGSWILKKLEFPKTMAELAYQAANDADVGGRLWAISQLAGREDGQAALIAAAGDAFYGVRVEAVKAVADRDTLLKALTDPDYRVRAAAVGKIGEVENVRRVALNDSSHTVAAAAARALRDRESLMRVLQERGAVDEILVGAIAGLTEIREGYDVVATNAAYGRPTWVRTNAIGALAKWATADSRAKGLLLELVNDPEFGVRRAALGALGETGDRSLLPALEERARTETDARLRRAARTAARKLKDS